MRIIILAAAGTVFFAALFITAVVSLNAFGIITGRYTYPIEIEILRWAFGILGVATTALTAGGMSVVRKAEAEERQAELDYERTRIATVPPGKVFVPRGKAEMTKDDIDFINKAAEEFERKTAEHKAIREGEDTITVEPIIHKITIPQPVVWDGELTIQQEQTE